MKRLHQRIRLFVLSAALVAPIPAAAAMPTVLAQFFENLDEEPAAPPGEELPPAQNPELEGLDLNDLENGDLGDTPDRAPGWAFGDAPGAGEEASAGDIPPAFDPAERPGDE